MNKANIVFVLDRSQLANNVAQAARAMANFGFSELRLVAPLNLPSAERMAREASMSFKTPNNLKASKMH